MLRNINAIFVLVPKTILLKSLVSKESFPSGADNKRTGTAIPRDFSCMYTFFFMEIGVQRSTLSPSLKCFYFSRTDLQCLKTSFHTSDFSIAQLSSKPSGLIDNKYGYRSPEGTKLDLILSESLSHVLFFLFL